MKTLKGFKSIKNNITVLNLSKIQNIIEKHKNESKSLDLKILKENKLINKKFIKLKILGIMK